MQLSKALLILIQSGDLVFGVYLSHPIEYAGGWRGGPACFIFSATLGVKIPYQARILSEDMGDAQAPVAFLIDRKQFVIGNGDLILSPRLNSGSCSLEHAFGIGLTPGSTESMCFLAGMAEFDVSRVEVFAVI